MHKIYFFNWRSTKHIIQFWESVQIIEYEHKSFLKKFISIYLFTTELKSIEINKKRKILTVAFMLLNTLTLLKQSVGSDKLLMLTTFMSNE